MCRVSETGDDIGSLGGRYSCAHRVLLVALEVLCRWVDGGIVAIKSRLPKNLSLTPLRHGDDRGKLDPSEPNASKPSRRVRNLTRFLPPIHPSTCPSMPRSSSTQSQSQPGRRRRGAPAEGEEEEEVNMTSEEEATATQGTKGMSEEVSYQHNRHLHGRWS